MQELEKLGIKIGHYTNTDALTGATVFIPDHGADIGIDIRGSDTGSINIPAYEIKGADKLVRAIVLTGGSTPGLESAIGVMDYLNTASVCGACIYDGNASKTRPHLIDGYNMAKTANYDNLGQGNIGVGTGATTGKLNGDTGIKGGFGISIKEISKGAYLGAFVVTNATGNVINPTTKKFYSESGGYTIDNYHHANLERGTNTTLAVIVTNIALKRDELMKISELAQDGMARAIFPVHTNWDGDIVFSISPHGDCRIKLDMDSFDLVNWVGVQASVLTIEAINNSLRNAKGIDGFPSYNELYTPTE